MSNLWPLIVLPLIAACGDKDDDTAAEEETTEETAEDTAEEAVEEEHSGGGVNTHASLLFILLSTCGLHKVSPSSSSL